MESVSTSPAIQTWLPADQKAFDWAATVVKLVAAAFFAGTTEALIGGIVAFLVFDNKDMAVFHFFGAFIPLWIGGIALRMHWWRSNSYYSKPRQGVFELTESSVRLRLGQETRELRLSDIVSILVVHVERSPDIGHVVFVQNGQSAASPPLPDASAWCPGFALTFWFVKDPDLVAYACEDACAKANPGRPPVEVIRSDKRGASEYVRAATEHWPAWRIDGRRLSSGDERDGRSLPVVLERWEPARVKAYYRRHRMRYLFAAACGVLAFAIVVMLAPWELLEKGGSNPSISSGAEHSCATTPAGGLKCWGWILGRPLGDEVVDLRVAADVKGTESGVAAITSDYNLACAITKEGQAVWWGVLRYRTGEREWRYGGYLDKWEDFRRSSPGHVSDLDVSVRAIAAGKNHCCAITNAGGVFCWGINDEGQIGIGETENDYSSGSVSGLGPNVQAVSSGGSHSCAVTSYGGVLCWGNNEHGQLGDGTTESRLVPTPVSGLDSGVVAIAAGRRHSCAMTSAGRVLCWGSNSYGQLGTGKQESSHLPVEVLGLTDAKAIVVGGDDTFHQGGDHSCAISSESGVVCWGCNKYGQLGNGTASDSAVPTPVYGLSSGVVAISAGDARTCAIKDTGRAVCWGKYTGDFRKTGSGRWNMDGWRPARVIDFPTPDFPIWPGITMLVLSLAALGLLLYMALRTTGSIVTQNVTFELTRRSVIVRVGSLYRELPFSEIETVTVKPVWMNKRVAHVVFHQKGTPTSPLAIPVDKPTYSSVWDSIIVGSAKLHIDAQLERGTLTFWLVENAEEVRRRVLTAHYEYHGLLTSVNLRRVCADPCGSGYPQR